MDYKYLLSERSRLLNDLQEVVNFAQANYWSPEETEIAILEKIKDWQIIFLNYRRQCPPVFDFNNPDMRIVLLDSIIDDNEKRIQNSFVAKQITNSGVPQNRQDTNSATQIQNLGNNVENEWLDDDIAFQRKIQEMDIDSKKKIIEIRQKTQEEIQKKRLKSW